MKLTIEITTKNDTESIEALAKAHGWKRGVTIDPETGEEIPPVKPADYLTAAIQKRFADLLEDHEINKVRQEIIRDQDNQIKVAQQAAIETLKTESQITVALSETKEE